MKPRLPQLPHVLARVAPERNLLRADAVLLCALIFLPNLAIVGHFVHIKVDRSITDSLPALAGIDTLFAKENFLYWGGANALMLLLFFILRRHLLLPVMRMLHQLHSALTTMMQDTPHPMPFLLNMRLIAGDVTRFALVAQEYYRKHQEVSIALEEARNLLAQITLQQQSLIATTSREMIGQYQSVLAYANYLEEHIATTTTDTSLRYGFDDVCESGFNLKLIAGALTLLRNPQLPILSPIPLALLMQQTMLALAPSLDRRCMKLTTAEVDTSVIATSNPALIEHVLWMMLLGTIRYAANESTLRMRCLYNHTRTEALVSIVVSELSPGQLLPAERSAYLQHQLEHLTPHLFAETIRIHANVRLAELLVKPLDASISILPLTHHACEICLTLPTACG